MVKRQKTIFTQDSARASPGSDLPPLTPQEIDEAKKNAAKELAKEQIKETLKAQQQLTKLRTQTNEVIFKAKSVFPFDLFPDEIVIDANKINVIHRLFFFSDRVESVQIRDIRDVSIETSFFFAKLIVVPNSQKDISFFVRYLKKGDAVKARDLIEGLIVSEREEVTPPEEIFKQVPQQIEEIGKVLAE